VIDNRVVYFEANGNVAAGGEVFVVSLPADLGLTRVSGRLLFTRDGKLLVAIGDLTAEASAQDDGVLVGKILRYNDDGSIPDDNPLSGSPVYARGLRDVRGLCLDPDGTPVAVDRNERGHSEVNRVEPAKTYGWPNVVGKATTPAELEYVAANPTYVDPLLDAGMSDPALAGGSFNPSTRYGPNSWQHFFYGEAGDRRVIHGTLSPGHERTEVFATGFPSPITDVAFAPAGTLYVACTNAIFQIVPSK
jgi:glucose/arabinose dehydrogenase